MAILNAIKLKGYTTKFSNSNKIIKKFDKTDCADNLQKFLLLHRSCIAVFEAYVKSSDYSLTDIASKIKNILKEMNTSFIYIAECSCGNILEAPNIAINNFELQEKQVTCHKCGKQKDIQKSDYHPDFEFKTRDCAKEVYKVLMFASENGVLDKNVSKECYACGDTEDIEEKDEKSVNLKCSKCGKTSNVITSFLPKEVLEPIIKYKQGYWLEWFIYRLLKNEDYEVGVELCNKDNLKYESDIILLKDNKITIISCKDSTAEDTDIKLVLINEIANQFIMVTTRDNSQSPIVKASQRMFKERFSLIAVDKIENIKSYLSS